MADFCTVEDIEALLQVEITTATQIASAEAAIAAATEAIRNYCHQHIELVEDDIVMLDVAEVTRTRVFLPELPVTEVTAVVEDGETLVVDDDYKLGRNGILHRMGTYWEAGIQILQVTYSHGYATLPDDVVAVATRAAARTYQAGLRSAESEGLPGIQATSLGDYSVTYQQDGAAEGVLGVSGARMLLLSEKDVLARYRYVAL